jgi:hypothetical protein
VQYVVAPYEADAQLAFLTKNGLADGVITEDSDCLPFGCGTVLFKLDKDGVGVGQEIKASNLKKNKGLLFHMFTHEMVRRHHEDAEGLTEVVFYGGLSLLLFFALVFRDVHFLGM